MTPKERVIAALHHMEPDIIPWGEHHINYNIYEMILGRPSLVHAKFKLAKAYWEGRRDEVVESFKRDTVDLTRALEMDLVTVTMMPQKNYAPEPLVKIDEYNYKDNVGTIYRYSEQTEDLYPFPMNTSYFHYDITLEEIERMVDEHKTLPPIDPNPNVPEYEVINHVVRELGKTHFVIAPINGIEWARFGKTEEDSWVNLLLYPDICQKIAELQYVNTIRELDRIKASGVDGVLNVGDLGNTTNLAAPVQIYRKNIFPFHQKIYAECKKRGLYVLRHCCGHVWPVMDELCECNDAYEGIQEFAGMDIVKLKNKYGEKICLWGGVKHENIHGGTVKDVRADIERSCRFAAKGGGYIMGSSHSLTVGAPLDNILAMKKYRKIYGSKG